MNPHEIEWLNEFRNWMAAGRDRTGPEWQELLSEVSAIALHTDGEARVTAAHLLAEAAGLRETCVEGE